MNDPRAYPDRPFLAVSAAIIRDDRFLLVRRAMPPAEGLYTLPGGVVEAGETLTDAVCREVREETAIEIQPIALAGYREAIVRDETGQIKRHFVILPFACRHVRGEPALNGELVEARWALPSELDGIRTTEGLAGIVEAAFAIAAKA